LSMLSVVRGAGPAHLEALVVDFTGQVKEH
jgi:hypothetical protein